MKVPFFDLKKQYISIKEELDSAIGNVFSDLAFSGGSYVDSFEREFSRYCGVGFASGVSSGTDALHLAVRALDIGAGDEVILPANSFVATAWCVSYVNATPVFADCDPYTWNIDPAKIEGLITGRTKAVIGVHLYGQPFDVDRVKGLSVRHGLHLIEDCAHAPGAIYKGKKAGSFGELSCFSFYPGKNLGAYGEAGAVVTDNEAHDRRIKALRNHGSVLRYHHDSIGFNMRMDGIQGAVLSVKLKHLDEWNARRREIALRYRSGIKNPKIRMQEEAGHTRPVYHLFVVVTEKRDLLRAYLDGEGISTGVHYPIPIHLQKAYSHLGYVLGDCPNAEALSEGCLSLPMYPEMSDQEADRVIEAVNRY